MAPSSVLGGVRGYIGLRHGWVVKVGASGSNLTLGTSAVHAACASWASATPSACPRIRPGELVQIDTLFVNVAPDKAVKHFTAYDPVAKWTVASSAAQPRAAPQPFSARRNRRGTSSLQFLANLQAEPRHLPI
jgi:hypothetical protein